MPQKGTGPPGERHSQDRRLDLMAVRLEAQTFRTGLQTPSGGVNKTRGIGVKGDKFGVDCTCRQALDTRVVIEKSRVFYAQIAFCPIVLFFIIKALPAFEVLI